MRAVLDALPRFPCHSLLFFLCLHTFFTLGWDFPNDGRVSCQEIIAAPGDKCFSVDCIETTWCSRWHRGLGMFLIWCSLPAGSGLQNCLSSPTHTLMHTLKTFVVHFPPHIASRILLVCDCFLSSETLERSRTHLSGLVNRSLQGLKKNPLRHLILKRCLWPRCRPGVEQRALQSWNFNVHVSRHKHFD